MPLKQVGEDVNPVSFFPLCPSVKSHAIHRVLYSQPSWRRPLYYGVFILLLPRMAATAVLINQGILRPCWSVVPKAFLYWFNFMIIILCLDNVSGIKGLHMLAQYFWSNYPRIRKWQKSNKIETAQARSRSLWRWFRSWEIRAKWALLPSLHAQLQKQSQQPI